MGFPGGTVGKESTCKVKDLGSIPGLGRSPGGGHSNPLQYSCLENPYGFCSPPQRSLASYSPRGHKELDMTEQLSTAQHVIINGLSLRRSWETATEHIVEMRFPLWETGKHKMLENKKNIYRDFFFSLPATPFLIPCFRMIVCLSKCVWQLGKHKRKNKDKNHLRMTSVFLLCLNFVIRLGFCSEL